MLAHALQSVSVAATFAQAREVVTVFDMAMHANVAEQSASCHVSCHQHSKAVCVVNSTQMYCDENIRQNKFQQTAVRTF